MRNLKKDVVETKGRIRIKGPRMDVEGSLVIFYIMSLMKLFKILIRLIIGGEVDIKLEAVLKLTNHLEHSRSFQECFGIFRGKLG